MRISSWRLRRATCGRRWRWWQFQNWVSTTSLRHVLRTNLRVISNVAIGASSVYSIVLSRVRSCQCSKKMVPPCCDWSSKHERWRIRHGTLFVDCPRWKRCHSCSVLGLRRGFHVGVQWLSIGKTCLWEHWQSVWMVNMGGTSVETVWRTNPSNLH